MPRHKLEKFLPAFDAEVRRQLQEEDLQTVLLKVGNMSVEVFHFGRVEQLRDGDPWEQSFSDPVFWVNFAWYHNVSSGKNT